MRNKIETNMKLTAKSTQSSAFTDRWNHILK